MHLEPLSFEEYLLAHQKKTLNDYLVNYHLDQEMPSIIHDQLIMLYKEYMIIGGMPEAVASWIDERSLTKVNQTHHDLLATFRDDFAKYSSRARTHSIDEVMMAVPKMLGQKFIYSHVNPQLNSVTANSL